MCGAEHYRRMEQCPRDAEDWAILCTPIMTSRERYEDAGRLLFDADYILIAAGAGLSAAAGLDYTDQDIFREMFPAMWNVGFRCMYHFIGYHSPLCPDKITPWSPELKWGYLADQTFHARFNWPQHEVYNSIRQLLKSKDEDKTFVVSTNADGMFVQNGFNPTRVYNPQGDYSHMQCLTPCRQDAYWPSYEVISKQILPTVDKSTQKCSSDAVPHCPHCGGPVFFNVRGGDWFIEDVSDRRSAYISWLRQTVGKKLVILEVGVGFNTPSVLRWPMESIVEHNAEAGLIRVNREHPEVPADLKDRCMEISADAQEAVLEIVNQYFLRLQGGV